jgi:hypothetical protein
MAGRFGTKCCSHCGREFELVRKEQHLCCRPCHDEWFIRERREALAAWRARKRMGSFFVSAIQLSREASEKDTQIRKAG